MAIVAPSLVLSSLFLGLRSARTASFVSPASFAARRLHSRSMTMASQGDYCGWSATFDTNGKLIPIPEYYIPEAMLEWGQVPSSLEVVTSEEGTEQQTITVYPAVGCSVDNLDTKVSKVSWDGKEEGEGSRVTYKTDGIVEATFAMDDEHRVRVKLSAQSNALQKPITIVVEHRFSDKSTQGTLADGGGLDGQRVARWQGDYIRSVANFAEETVPQSVESGGVSFPGNITITTRNTEPLALEIGHQDRSVEVSFTSPIQVSLRRVEETSESRV